MEEQKEDGGTVTGNREFKQFFIENKTCIIKIVTLLLLFFGINSYLSFATDTFEVFSIGFEAAAKDMFRRNGRPVIALIYFIHYLTGLSNECFYYISSVFALIFLGLSIWIFQKILSKYEINENSRILLAFTAIANIYIIEYFSFIEKMGFMMAIFFSILGVYWIENFFESRRKKSLIFSILAITLAILTYQGSIALFVILSIPFALKKSKQAKDYILNILTIGGTYAIPVIIDMILFKFVFKSSRIKEGFDIAKYFKRFTSGLISSGKTSFGILPENLFKILTVIILFLSVLLAIRNSKRIINLINILILTLAACIFPAATILQGSAWWLPRIVYPIASLISVLVINMFINCDKSDFEDLKEKIMKILSLSVLGILLVFQFFSFNKIYIDRYKVNALDEFRYQCIEQSIQEYEQSTGKKITKVAFYSDKKMMLQAYSHLFPKDYIVVSSFKRSWSDAKAMNYYLNKKYKKVTPSEEYKKYFSQKDWNKFSKEQLIFENDTLHICVY